MNFFLNEGIFLQLGANVFVEFENVFLIGGNIFIRERVRRRREGGERGGEREGGELLREKREERRGERR